MTVELHKSLPMTHCMSWKHQSCRRSHYFGTSVRTAEFSSSPHSASLTTLAAMWAPAPSAMLASISVATREALCPCSTHVYSRLTADAARQRTNSDERTDCRGQNTSGVAMLIIHVFGQINHSSAVFFARGQTAFLLQQNEKKLNKSTKY